MAGVQVISFSLHTLSLYQLAIFYLALKRAFLDEQAAAVRAEAERRVVQEGADFIAQLARVANASA